MSITYNLNWYASNSNGDYDFAFLNTSGEHSSEIRSIKLAGLLSTFEKSIDSVFSHINTPNSVSITTSNSSVNGKVIYTSPTSNNEVGKFTIQNGNVRYVEKVTLSGNLLGETRTFSFFIDYPFVLLIQGHSYQGTFSSDSLTTQDKETYQAVANLVSLDSGKNIGEARITTGNILKIYVRNESGGLEALLPPGN